MRVPGSKSISNRALLLAGFAAGTTTIEGLLHSDDTHVMLEALKQLGCRIEGDGDALLVTGLGARPLTQQSILWLGNAGTAMRPLVAALALGAAPGARFEFRGTPRMHERPIGDLVDALRSLGCAIEYLEQPGFPPLVVHPPPAPLDLDRPIVVRGDVSSQFLTALLLALPQRAGSAGATVEVAGELISKPYVDITLRLLERFGVVVARDGWRRFHVVGAERPASRRAASSSRATPPRRRTSSPPRRSPRATRRCASKASAANRSRATSPSSTPSARWARRSTPSRTALTVRRGRFPLAPITLDCNHIPDAAMTLAALALFASGPSRLENIASWRVKETDRLAAMAAELRKLGADVVEGARQPGDHAARALARRIDRDLRRPPHGDGDVARGLQRRCRRGAADAGADRRPALRRQDLARLLRGAVLGRLGRSRRRSRRSPSTARPLRARARWRARSPPSSATCCSTRARVYRAVAIAALQAGVEADDEAALEALARTMDLRFDAGRTFLAGADVSDSLRLEAVGALASRISAWPARAPGRPRRPDRVPPPARPGRRRPRHGHGRLPRRQPQGLPHRERRRTCRAPAQAVDFKGYFR